MTISSNGDIVCINAGVSKKFYSLKLEKTFTLRNVWFAYLFILFPLSLKVKIMLKYILD